MNDDDESPYSEDVGLNGYKPWRGRAELIAMQPEFRDREFEAKLHLWFCVGLCLAGVGLMIWIFIEISKVKQ